MLRTNGENSIVVEAVVELGEKNVKIAAHFKLRMRVRHGTSNQVD